jgi:hypothetical protein
VHACVVVRLSRHGQSSEAAPAAVTLDTIRAAAATIAPHVRRTPVDTCGFIDRLAGRSVFFKCELFQVSACARWELGVCGLGWRLCVLLVGCVGAGLGPHAHTVTCTLTLRCWLRRWRCPLPWAPEKWVL